MNEVYSGHPAALLRARRTIPQNRFGSAEPDHAKVIEAIESARWAPNHRHTEPWRFYVLDPERIRRLGELYSEVLRVKGAPETKAEFKRKVWSSQKGVVIATRSSQLQENPNGDFAIDKANDILQREDYAACCCAIQNFMLHLWADGIGVKWSTGRVWDHPNFNALIGIEAQPEEVIGVLFYGVLPDNLPIGVRKKALNEVVVNYRAAGA